MNYIQRDTLRLVSRNEGKIKSYESCSDLRAWSHDVETRDRYLREWIRNDMPVCIIPLSTLANFLRNMTYKNRGNVTPRCHPNCKSRVVLESICTSCHHMKSCLGRDSTFDKYFEEEEFETCHWPCERCLDALKSIKMFWKVIVEKVFRIHVPKSEELCNSRSLCTDSVRKTAKVWQKEMVHQALLLDHLLPCQREGSRLSKQPKSTKLESCISSHTYKVDSVNSCKTRNDHSVRSKDTKSRGNDPLLSGVVKPHKKRKTVSRFISVRVRTVDFSCDTTDLPKGVEDSGAYKNSLKFLQQDLNEQKLEVERLKKENTSLKFELQNVYNGFSLSSHFCSPVGFCPPNQSLCRIPKPFECVDDVSSDPLVKNIDSEMIITMKKCHNPKYRHVSLFQVLHKSNVPIPDNPPDLCCRREDPSKLLTKMQDVFGAIVKREMSIVSDKRRSRTKMTDIDASFHRITFSRSAPSCTTLGSKSKISVGQPVCTKDIKN
ncbi:uncharacterized protein [Choristoneura fumiferana]|uniref:uncharacterized protein n=1 Tax=Choristoneura fumiferana TaxID=7141 RepID=UPI003D1583A3